MTEPSSSRYNYVLMNEIQTIPFSQRVNLVTVEEFAKPPKASLDFLNFFESLPKTSQRTNAAGSLVDLVSAITSARDKHRSIIWAYGPHVVKYGLSLLIIDLMKRGCVTALATTGAGAIHDSEIALFGQTSEEMTGEIQTGRFGMARETGEFINECAKIAHLSKIGFGEALGRRLVELDAPFSEYSILAQAYKLNIPITIHVALGTDIVHAQPSFDGQHTGAATQFDFQILSSAMENLSDGGVHLNIVSNVILPEIFLKCFTVINNIRVSKNKPHISGFMTANIDHSSEYRPLMNVLKRPTHGVGKGVELLGRVEIMLPLLSSLITSSIDSQNLPLK